MTPPDSRAALAYKLYIKDDLSLDAVKGILRVDRRRVRDWIVALGGEIREHGYQGDRDIDTETQVGPAQTGWRRATVCSIGHSTRGKYSIGDSWYCAEHCEHGRCEEKATAADLAAFKRLEKKRKADDKLIAERKAKKLSGAFGTGGLWRG